MALQKFASGNQYRVAYTLETEFNVTPLTPSLVELPKATFTPSPAYETMTANNMTSTGLEEEDRLGNVSIAGELTGDLLHNAYDDLFHAGFGQAWVNNTLKNASVAGEALPSLTIEKGNLAYGKFERFTGVRVGGLTFTIEPGSIASLSVELMGAGVATATTPLDADVPIASYSRAMSHIGGGISIDGQPAICTSFTVSLSNQLEAAYGIGSSTAHEIARGNSQVTFSGTCYVENDDRIYNAYLNETLIDIAVQVTDGDDTLTLTIPNAKILVADRPLSGAGLLFINFSGKGYRDAASECSLMLTRTV